MKIINRILQDDDLFSHIESTDYQRRMKVMEGLIYNRVYGKIKHSILEKDKIFIALKFT